MLLLEAYREGAEEKDDVPAPRQTLTLAARSPPHRVRGAQEGKLPLHIAAGGGVEGVVSEELVMLLLEAYREGAEEKDDVPALSEPRQTLTLAARARAPPAWEFRHVHDS